MLNLDGSFRMCIQRPLHSDSDELPDSARRKVMAIAMAMATAVVVAVGEEIAMVFVVRLTNAALEWDCCFLFVFFFVRCGDFASLLAF